MIQQDEKLAYSRHKAQGLVTLIPSFITTKMLAYHLALREFSTNASTALQCLKRTRHFLRALRLVLTFVLSSETCSFNGFGYNYTPKVSYETVS